MSDILPTNPTIEQVSVPTTPHDQLVNELRKPNSIEYKTNAGQFGGVINVYVTEANPQNPALNKINIDNGKPTAVELSLPIADSVEIAPNLIVEITKGTIHQAPIRLTIEREEEFQVARLSLDLRAITDGFGRKDFSLQELSANFFTLADVAATFKNIDDKAKEINDTTWSVRFDEPTDGPVLERRTLHGQTEESFTEVFRQLTNGKLTIRQEAVKEKFKRAFSGSYP